MCVSTGLALLAGCASAPPPVPSEALSRAEYTITEARRAVEEGVQSVPLYEAEQKMEAARALVSSQARTAEDVARAERLAQRAVLDAELARARAARRAAEARVAELEAALAQLRQRLDQTEEGER